MTLAEVLSRADLNVSEREFAGKDSEGTWRACECGVCLSTQSPCPTRNGGECSAHAQHTWAAGRQARQPEQRDPLGQLDDMAVAPMGLALGQRIVERSQQPLDRDEHLRSEGRCALHQRSAAAQVAGARAGLRTADANQLELIRRQQEIDARVSDMARARAQTAPQAFE